MTLAQSSHGFPHGDPSSLVVVQDGQRLGLVSHAVRVEEPLGDELAKDEIVTAASPLPLFVRLLQTVVCFAAAKRETALTAVARNGVGHPCAEDRVHEGRLPVVLQPLLVASERGGRAVPHVVAELLCALRHCQLCSNSDAVGEVLVDVATSR